MNITRRTTATTATAVALATAGGLLGVVSAPSASAATVTCNSPAYKRQFFANTTFSGTPKKTDCDASIAENWGAKAPATGLPKDNFGVRWTVTRDFGSGGPFALTVAAQDGIRVYLDGKIKVNLWKNVSTTQKKTVNLTIPAHKHTLRIDFANVTGNANVNFAYAPRTSATVDKVKPLAPTGPAVTYDKTTGKAKLTWAKNKEMDLAGYKVYRRLNGTSFGGTALATTTATTYTDSTLPKTGETYAYEVRAHDKAGNQSTGSADVTATTVDKTAPAKVTGLSGQGTTAGNFLTWNASSKDVHHYEVWAAPVGQSDPDGPQPAFRTSSADQFADAGTPYAYRVQAVDGAGNISPVSETVTVTRPVASTTPAPSALEGTPTDASTHVTWTPSEDGTVTGFHVYRRASANGVGTLVGSVDGPTASSYDDTSAPKGTAYYYVTAVDNTGAESVPSAQIPVARLTPATATGPAAPKLTVVSTGGTRSPIIVQAKPGAGDEGRSLKGYSWYFDGYGSPSGQQLTTTGRIEFRPQYTGVYMVTVRAVDVYGRESEQVSSAEVLVNR
ncbi:PA14 domain-containing protein [Streptomyces sp. NBC_00576]|uniref:PA14 domain-containing protein n=1 Tax=Streptomyces sp. NBC_00576 TaxID=2903665 RepID=UPI002E8179E7|nr:PA14 domain-containing protein [Streptomyces sp. NBC_00576]WUB73162.1 PA14 domain-containing protein [Streptomyces sp. NBC_00576]